VSGTAPYVISLLSGEEPVKKFLQQFLRSSFSAIEVMEFMTVFNKLLLLMFARVYRWPEISDLRCLKCRAKRAECCIHFIGFLADRAIVNTIGYLD